MKEAFQADAALTDILASLLTLKHFTKDLYLGQYLIPHNNYSCQSFQTPI